MTAVTAPAPAAAIHRFEKREGLAKLQQMTRLTLLAAAVSVITCTRHGSDVVVDSTGLEPGWHFVRTTVHGVDATLTAIWGRSDGVKFAVGWDGTIASNRAALATPTNVDERAGPWHRVASPTAAHLTAITGLANGGLFGLPAVEGEMFAVGWNGTLLYYNPNPDGDPTTDDGAWQALSSPEAPTLTELFRIDPACPDYDGDGIADDGDASGFWGDALCAGGNATSCDDNCRSSPNGPERPLTDLDADGCLGPTDGPSPDTSLVQRDEDSDGAGAACDDDDLAAASAHKLTSSLFGVWAQAQGNQVTVIAVGENGSIVRYSGPSAAVAPAPGQPRIDDPSSWVAQSRVSFRYDSDCPPGTPAGTVCSGSGILPPACPAQCNPRRTQCDCPVGAGQCCDPTASTGAACSDASCPAAANACDGATGVCSTLCPACVRRLDETLRSVAVSGGTLVAVGASGTVVQTPVANAAIEWLSASCSPAPVDEHPLFTSVHGGGGRFEVVGSHGAVLRYDPSAGCPFNATQGAPPVFLSGVVSSGSVSFAVGDKGVLLRLSGSSMESLATGVSENLLGVWANAGDEAWVVGPKGLLLRAFYVPPRP